MSSCRTPLLLSSPSTASSSLHFTQYALHLNFYSTRKPPMQFRRSISTMGLLFTSLSCMIGSGWLFGAYYASRIAGPAAIVSWGLAGFMIIFIALSFAELSSSLPVAGGISRFAQFSHGTLVSFCMSWLAWLSCVSVAPTEVQAILQYSTQYFPWLTTNANGIHLLTIPGFAVACVLLLALAGFNMITIKILTNYNAAITIWKLVVPIICAIVLLVHVKFDMHNFTAVGGFAPMGWHGILWALPTAGIIFSFLGFREATSLAEEAERPQIAIPVAVVGSVIICILLYELIQIAFISGLQPHMLKDGWQHMSFTGDAGPFAGLASALGLGWLVILIYSDSLISPLGTALVYTATTARLNYAMSKNNYIPAIMLRLNKRGLPVHAIFFNFLIGLFLFLPFKGWQALVAFQSTAIVLAYIIGAVSLLALREQLPFLHRPFKLPYKKVISYITFNVCTLMAYWSGWEIIWHLMLSLLLGIIILFTYRVFKEKTHSDLNIKSSLWLIPYFGGLSVISYLGSFGGGINLIPFGWDFLVIAIFSAIILTLSYYSRLDSEKVRAQIPVEFL